MKQESGFYATDKGELLVAFGGKIRISVFVIKDNEGNVIKELSLNELPKDHEIGEYLENEDHDTFHPVRLEFYDDASIDVLIEQLQQLKNFKN